MSLPIPMDCIAPQCLWPLRCTHRGSCRERDVTSAREYAVGIEASRLSGVMNPWANTTGNRTRRDEVGST